MSPLKFLGLAVLAGCAGTPATSVAMTEVAGEGSVVRGAALVRSRCAACHAVGPAGTSPLAAAPPFRELGRRYPVSSLQESFAEGMVTAHPDMPEFIFEPGQVRDLIAYLESVQDAAPGAR